MFPVSVVWYYVVCPCTEEVVKVFLGHLAQIFLGVGIGIRYHILLYLLVWSQLVIFLCGMLSFISFDRTDFLELVHGMCVSVVLDTGYNFPNVPTYKRQLCFFLVHCIRCHQLLPNFFWMMQYWLPRTCPCLFFSCYREQVQTQKMEEEEVSVYSITSEDDEIILDNSNPKPSTAQKEVSPHGPEPGQKTWMLLHYSIT